MSNIFLERIDAAPLEVSEFNPFLYQWIASLVDTMNETFDEIETALNIYNNGLIFPSFTQAEIIAMATAAENGTAWYCTDSSPPNVVIKINGSLVQLTTSPFP